jgi:DNA polymerase
VDLNQWKLASLQYLEHLGKLGIRNLPKPHSNLKEVLVDWSDPAPKTTQAAQAAQAVQGAPEAKLAHDAPVPLKPRPAATVQSPVQASPPVSLPNVPKKPSGPQVESPWLTPARNGAERTDALAALKLKVEGCRMCNELACGRRQTVFGVGPVTTRFVMVGEAPGAEEDRVGEPFVGPAGQLLDKILVATGIPREQVYILNTIKCRPPNNRVPSEVELENCRPFFEEQLEILQPEYIVCWGATAVRAILGTSEPVGKLRGRFHWYQKAKVVVTYHPSYLLRAPEAKKLTWEDMKMLMRELGTLKT